MSNKNKVLLGWFIFLAPVALFFAGSAVYWPDSFLHAIKMIAAGTIVVLWILLITWLITRN